MKRSRDVVSDEDSVSMSMTSSLEERINGYYSDSVIENPPDLDDVVTPYNFMHNINRCFGKHVKPARRKWCPDNLNPPYSFKGQNECPRTLVMDEDAHHSSSEWDTAKKVIIANYPLWSRARASITKLNEFRFDGQRVPSDCLVDKSTDLFSMMPKNMSNFPDVRVLSEPTFEKDYFEVGE
jgi:hypothetical protein